MRMNEQREHLLKAVDRALLEAQPLWPLKPFSIGRTNLVWYLPKPPKTIVFKGLDSNVEYEVYNYEEILELFKKEIKKHWRKE